MRYETILLDRGDDGVATITLNRPDRMNAFNRQMAAEFRDVWSSIRLDDAVRAVVLRAAGERAFCTGVDVTTGWGQQTDNPFHADDPVQWLSPKLNGVWKPMVTAVHGFCAGGAFYWLNESDIVICSDDAQFFDPHVTFGLVSAVEPAGMLGRVPLPEILRMALLGNDERVSAATALRISLVTEVVERERLHARANELAAAIARKPAAAVQGTVRAIWDALDLPRSAAVANALKYTQLGNPLGQAQIDRSAMPKTPWTLR